jgi:hypothetical protein
MSNAEVKFNFDTVVDAQNFFYELHLFETAEIQISEFQHRLYCRLRRKKYSKDPKEIELLKEILAEYNELFSDFVSSYNPDNVDVEQEKLKEKNT